MQQVLQRGGRHWFLLQLTTWNSPKASQFTTSGAMTSPTMLFFGTGLIGLAGAARKNNFQF
jgi:hypothetical protein